MKKIVLAGLLMIGFLNAFSQSIPSVGPYGIGVPNFTSANRLAIS